MTVLIICLVAFAILGHGYLWVDIINPLHGWAGNRKLIDGITLLCFLAFVILPILIVLNWRELDLANLSHYESGFSLLHCYFFLSACYGAGRWALSTFFRRASNNPKILLHRRQEASTTTARLGKEVFQGSFPQLLANIPMNSSLQAIVDHKRLAIPLLSKHHAGLRIAHISDLHMTGRISPEWYQAIVEQVNQLKPDVIAITGDLVEKEECLPALVDALGKLEATHGVYFILGNHDYYLDTDQTRKLLQDQGLICLSGCSIKTEWQRAPVILLGNERPWNPEAVDPPSSITKDSDQLPLRIALLHTPDQFSWACDHQADLALAGHTHGGQICFPLLGAVACPSLYGTRYASGVFRRGNTVLHVTRGLSGKTPLRWNCPPEIAILELTRS